MVYPPWNRVGVCWGGVVCFGGSLCGLWVVDLLGVVFLEAFYVGCGWGVCYGEWRLSAYHEHLLKNMAVMLHEIG